MGCWCHALYGQYRLAGPGGLCQLCAAGPGTCHPVHVEIQARMIERAEHEIAKLNLFPAPRARV